MSMNIFMMPKDNNLYIDRLASSLKRINVNVVTLRPWHYSSIVNMIEILFYRMKNYRIIHVHWLYVFPLSFVMKLFYFLCRSLGIKIIWEMHDIIDHKNSDKDIRDAKWFYEHSDAVILHSQSDLHRVKEMLATNMNKEYIVVPHGNFNGLYENKISKKEARKKLDLSENNKVILCFGSIRENRGYEYLLEAAKNMKDTIVIVAGRAEHKTVHKKLVDYEKKMLNLRLFVKWIPDKELQWYFNACDIVVLPYTHITTSGVVPTAYAFSRPVVTTTIGGIKDIVNENTGLLVPPGNAEALRMAIERIFNMDYEAMGRYAYDYADKEFSWELNANKIKSLYESITE